MTLFTNIKSFDKSFLLKLWLSLILYQLSVCPVSAQKDTMDIKDYILIINTYTESFPWSNRLISTATNFVKTIETHQHRKIACLEEIGYLNGWIGKDQLLTDIEPLKKNQYGQYLMDVMNGKYIDK